jgi:hypothetical protein
MGKEGGGLANSRRGGGAAARSPEQGTKDGVASSVGRWPTDREREPRRGDLGLGFARDGESASCRHRGRLYTSGGGDFVGRPATASCLEACNGSVRHRAAHRAACWTGACPCRAACLGDGPGMAWYLGPGRHGPGGHRAVPCLG